jgi:hypothetical protein
LSQFHKLCGLQANQPKSLTSKAIGEGFLQAVKNLCGPQETVQNQGEISPDCMASRAIRNSCGLQASQFED